MKIKLLAFFFLCITCFGQNEGVMTKGTQTVSGVKYFTNNNLRVSTTPVSSNEAASKVYVDNSLVLTNATGPGITITNKTVVLSTNGWTMGLGTDAINSLITGFASTGTVYNADNWTGSNTLAQAIGGKLGTNDVAYDSARLGGILASAYLTNNWTGGPVTLDGTDSNTNIFGGNIIQLGNGLTHRVVMGNDHGPFTNTPGPRSFSGYESTASGIKAFAFGDMNLASGNNSFAGGGSGNTASGLRAYALGQNATASNNNSFVWTDGNGIGSTADREFTVYAANGIRLLGGAITGNGSGLTGTGTTFTAGAALAASYSTSSGTATNALQLGNVLASGYQQTNTAYVAGGATPSLYAGTATSFASDGSLRNGVTMLTASSGYFTLAGGATNSTIFGGGVASDAWRRFRIMANGSFLWGDGTVIQDTLLSLSSRSNLTAYGTWTFNNIAGNGSGLTGTGTTFTAGNALSLVSGAQVNTMTITNLTTEGSQTMNGTANVAPNQTAGSTSSLLTLGLSRTDRTWVQISTPNTVAQGNSVITNYSAVSGYTGTVWFADTGAGTISNGLAETFNARVTFGIGQGSAGEWNFNLLINSTTNVLASAYLSINRGTCSTKYFEIPAGAVLRMHTSGTAGNLLNYWLAVERIP
jgi:hypothetical protein